MATANLTNIVTVETQVPAGITFDKLQLVIVDSAGARQTFDVPRGATTATFDVTLAAGDGNAKLQALDTAGNTIGQSVTNPFTYTPAAATFPQPVSFTINIV